MNDSTPVFRLVMPWPADMRIRRISQARVSEAALVRIEVEALESQGAAVCPFCLNRWPVCDNETTGVNECPCCERAVMLLMFIGGQGGRKYVTFPWAD